MDPFRVAQDVRLPSLKAPDYSASPRYVYWKMTQACGLACRHCRATSKRVPHNDEVSAVSMSVDGATAARTTQFATSAAASMTTMNAWDWIAELQIPLLVNTAVSDATHDDLPEIYALLRAKHSWSAGVSFSSSRSAAAAISRRFRANVPEAVMQ